MTKKKDEPYNEAKPPFFKHWSGMYWLLMGTLAVFILLFYLFTITFS